MRCKVDLGWWQVTSWGIKYQVRIEEISDFDGGSFEGPYICSDGERFPCGSFAMKNITKMKKISVDNR